MIMNQVFEKVRIRFEDNRPNRVFLVKYTNDPIGTKERASCISYLEDCGHAIDTKQIEEPTGKRTISYGRLSDIVESRDI